MSESVFPNAIDSDGRICMNKAGLSKRELFAGLILGGMLPIKTTEAEYAEMGGAEGMVRKTCVDAVVWADALLAALSNPGAKG